MWQYARSMARLRVLEFVRHDDGVWNLPPGQVEELAREFPDVEFVSPRTRAEADAAVSDADVILGAALTRANFAAARRLRWIHLTAAGVGHALFPELVASDIVVTNARGLHAVSMAEHTLAVLLAFARKLHLARDAQRDVHWAHRDMWADRPPFGDLGGASLGLLGLGAVGSAIAVRARALEMKVRAVCRRARTDPAPAHEVWTADRLGDLAAASDALVLAAPHTPATSGQVDAAVLARMPSHAVLVNLGRGALVDEPALIAALEGGRIAGAALDVFAEEPLPATSPLWRMPQVIATPHISGLGPRYWERTVAMFADHLRDFLAGRPLRNLVDKREGY
jgi:phosphoglycerate dehydrogenase-like enzyme